MLKKSEMRTKPTLGGVGTIWDILQGKQLSVSPAVPLQTSAFLRDYFSDQTNNLWIMSNNKEIRTTDARTLQGW